MGIAIVVEETELTDKMFLKKIEDFSKNIKNYTLKDGFSLPENPEKIIIEEIEKIAKPKITKQEI
jgi:hypothetical protein